MQKQSSRLLEAEARELQDALTHSLYSVIDKAMDGRHAVTILLDAGLIDEKAVRNISVINDYDIMRKNPLYLMKDIYYNLSVKYDVSINLVKKIVLERNK